MNTNAQLTPYDYYLRLMSLEVPGYEGYPGGVVSITEYVSANAMFGGASKAAVLSAALYKVAKDTNQLSIMQRSGFDRVFTGQGSCDNLAAAMAFISDNEDKFKAVPALKKYFTHTDYLQAMIDDKCFGQDCIGFVGTYLVEAGLEASYVGRRPLDYAAVFKPVKSLAEIQPYCVVMLTNGMHIQLIDTVNERGNGFIKVDLCQSSSGAERGPQCNVGVTISSGGGDYLPVEEFRQALASKQYAAQWEADNATRGPKQQRNYEMYLRSIMTKAHTAFGYCGGAIFTVTPNGEPANPVGGSVYIGNAGVTLKVPN